MRLAGGLMALVLVAAVVTGVVAASGVLEAFGLTSAEQRASGTKRRSSRMHSACGSGVSAWALPSTIPCSALVPAGSPGKVLRSPCRPQTRRMRPPTQQAHNIFIQLAAEMRNSGVALAALLGVSSSG